MFSAAFPNFCGVLLEASGFQVYLTMYLLILMRALCRSWCVFLHNIRLSSKSGGIEYALSED